LLAGLPGEALLHYQTSLDLLKSSNDWLWLAGKKRKKLPFSHITKRLLICSNLRMTGCGLQVRKEKNFLSVAVF
jgi:hypothetical protein